METAHIDNILPEVSNPSTLRLAFRTHPSSAPQLHILSSKSQSGLAGEWNKNLYWCRRGDKNLSTVRIPSMRIYWALGIHDQWKCCIAIVAERWLFNLKWFFKTGMKEKLICSLCFDNLPCCMISSQTPSNTVKSSTAISPLLPLPTVPSIIN